MTEKEGNRYIERYNEEIRSINEQMFRVYRLYVHGMNKITGISKSSYETFKHTMDDLVTKREVLIGLRKEINMMIIINQKTEQ